LLSLACYLAPCFTVEINVDVEKPEANGPFIIYDVGQTIEGVGKDSLGYNFYGYFVFYKMDLRWTVDEPERVFYKCHLSSYDTMQVTVPAWDYTHYMNRDDFEKQSNVGSNVIEAMDDAHDRFGKKKDERFSKHYKLTFKDHTLSAKTISLEATDDEIVPWDIVKVPWKHKKSKTSGTDYYACWAIVRTDKKSKKKGKPTHEVKELSDAAKKLQALGISLDGGNDDEEEGENGENGNQDMGA
jgi:hypothetical protein